MFSIQSVSAEDLAKLFHQYHEMLAPDFDCQPQSSPAWEQTPQNQRRLMVAAARLALDELACTNGTIAPDPDRRYFAKPGEAEWGC